MTETEKKALALLNECAGQEVYGGWGTFDPNQSPCTRALCRAIEQHEAFKQQVSDAVEDYCGYVPPDSPCHPITRFIIAKPDPLVEAMQDWWDTDGYASIETFRAAIEARGGRIVWEGE